jgi:hypothetical protein
MKANHICKYSKCNLGNNGQPKQYYACDYCDRINSWKSIACCKEHFDLYIEEELERKSMLNKINMLPKRIDMSDDEIKELYNIPADVVLEKTNQELQYYKDKYGIDNINEVVDKINDELNKEGRL